MESSNREKLLLPQKRRRRNRPNHSLKLSKKYRTEIRKNLKRQSPLKVLTQPMKIKVPINLISQQVTYKDSKTSASTDRKYTSGPTLKKSSSMRAPSLKKSLLPSTSDVKETISLLRICSTSKRTTSLLILNFPGTRTNLDCQRRRLRNSE